MKNSYNGCLRAAFNRSLGRLMGRQKSKQGKGNMKQHRQDKEHVKVVGLGSLPGGFEVGVSNPNGPNNQGDWSSRCGYGPPWL